MVTITEMNVPTLPMAFSVGSDTGIWVIDLQAKRKIRNHFINYIPSQLGKVKQGYDIETCFSVFICGSINIEIRQGRAQILTKCQNSNKKYKVWYPESQSIHPEE